MRSFPLISVNIGLVCLEGTLNSSATEGVFRIP